MNFEYFILYLRKNRFPILGVLIGINLFLGFQLNFLEIDNSLDVWFSKQDPTLKAYHEFRKNFGNDDVSIITLQFDSAGINTTRFKSIDQLDKKLEEVEGIHKVLSIADLPLSLQNKKIFTVHDYLCDSALSLKLIPRIEQYKELKSVKRFYGDNFSVMVLYVWLDTLPDISVRHSLIHQQINHEIVTLFGDEISINQSGSGIIYDALNRDTISKVPLMMGLSYLIVLFLVYVFTRRRRWVILTLGTITLSNITLFGIMALIGSKVTMVTMAIPLLINVIGVANIVHYAKSLQHFQINGASGLNLRQSILKPLFFNALTTAAGFASLAAANLKVTSDYGLYAAAGVLIAFLYSLLLSILFPGKQLSKKSDPFWLSKLENFITFLMLASVTNRKITIGTFIAILLIFGVGISKLEVDTNTLEFFPENHTVPTQIRMIENQLGYFYPDDFLISYEGKNWKHRDFILKMARFQNKIDADTLFGSSYSIVDVLNDSYCLLTGNPVSASDQMPLISQQKILAMARTIQQSESYSQLVTNSGKTVRLGITGPFGSAKEYLKLVELLKLKACLEFGENVEVQPAGTLPLYAQSIKYTLHDQLSSFGLALLVVILLIGILLKSFRLLLIAIPSNIIPILVILGIMGYAGIKLDIANITIAAALLGIIVDDTIHILYTYKQLKSSPYESNTLIRQLAHRKGTALVFTSVILCFGFLVIGLAGLKSIARPGLLISLSIFIALLTDLFLLPALLFSSSKNYTDNEI